MIYLHKITSIKLKRQIVSKFHCKQRLHTLLIPTPRHRLITGLLMKNYSSYLNKYRVFINLYGQQTYITQKLKNVLNLT